MFFTVTITKTDMNGVTRLTKTDFDEYIIETDISKEKLEAILKQLFPESSISITDKHPYFFWTDESDETGDDVQEVDWDVVYAKTVDEAIEIARVQYPKMHYTPAESWNPCFKCHANTLYLYESGDYEQGTCSMCGLTGKENRELWKTYKEKKTK
jgi:hypothetical protein